MSRKLSAMLYQAMSCDGVICSGIANVWLVSDRLNAYCQAISHTRAIDFMALIGLLSHPTLYVRETCSPIRTDGCRAPTRSRPGHRRWPVCLAPALAG